MPYCPSEAALPDPAGVASCAQDLSVGWAQHDLAHDMPSDISNKGQLAASGLLGGQAHPRSCSHLQPCHNKCSHAVKRHLHCLHALQCEQCCLWYAARETHACFVLPPSPAAAAAAAPLVHREDAAAAAEAVIAAAVEHTAHPEQAECPGAHDAGLAGHVEVSPAGHRRGHWMERLQLAHSLGCEQHRAGPDR